MFLWLLPLGAFIKPSQERIACDGKRPFHMCQMMAGKAERPTTSKIAISNNSSTGHEAKSSASGGDDLILLVHGKNSPLNISRFLRCSSVSDYTYFKDLITPPPNRTFLF